MPQRLISPQADALPVCQAEALTGGSEVVARIHHGETGFTAFASYDADGWPAITYSRAFDFLPPWARRFLALHECGHLVLRTTDELLANCYAVRAGHWSPAELAAIAAEHDAMGPLGPQYGGSGAAFWRGTVRTCPDLFEAR